MKLRYLVPLSLLTTALVVTPLAGAAKKPPKPGRGATLSLSTVPSTIAFGRSTLLSGHLTGTNHAGVRVSLRQDPYPFHSPVYIATAVTDANGHYSFTRSPKSNIQFRVDVRNTSVRSSMVQLGVRMRMTLNVSSLTPARGSRVKFSGVVRPAHDGRAVAVQRHTSTGWVTVSSMTLAHVAGRNASYYAKRVRITHSGTYRTRVAADADHATGTSRSRTLLVH